MSIESTVYARGLEKSVPASFTEALRAVQEPGKLAWISLVEPDEEDFNSIADSLGLEPRLLEEAARFPHRSYIERHDKRLIAVLPMLRASEDDDSKGGFKPVETDWVLVFAVEGQSMISTLTDSDPAVLDRLRRRMEGQLDRIAEDSRAVLFGIVSEVIGDYERAVEAIERHIWDAEVTVMEGKSGDVLRRIHALTNQTVGLQQEIKPLALALERLIEDDAPVVQRQLTRIRHRALRVTEKLDGARELLSSLLQVNLTVVGQKISAWGAILIVPSLIASVFGMNFNDAWWQKADHGFEVMVVVMLLISVTLYLWFKRAGWL